MTQIQKPIIILVNPQLGENIGAAARVMWNFGLEHLRIVNPRDEWPNEQALSVAVHASHVIQEAKIFSSLEAAVADINILYATTARKRYLNKTTITTRNMSEEIYKSSLNSTIKTGIMFGPERTGLHNDYLTIANKLVLIPTESNFSSLNLAQAVGIISYEIFMAKINNIPNANLNPTYELADHQDILSFFKHLESILDHKDFFKVAEKREGMINNIRNIFKRVTPLTKQDIRTLHGIIHILSK
ncbi:tRNA (cytidine/uridine-2'-O-)-methyltransferase TrmJ [Rickettsiales bacterium Ac37b]|nr:tRNA (cytidine/uridine-2'-O-)-methyltransferase TrmJ [Rickettsiales bacterium Ac37b]